MATLEDRSIFVVGETGNGKTHLCRFLTGSDKFVPSSSAKSDTTKVQKQTVQHGNHCITVYDTPGLGDSEGRSDSHIVEMVKELRQVRNCSAVILVLNYCQPRVSESTQETLKLFREIFGVEALLGRLVLVFTNGDLRLQEKRRVETHKYARELIEKVFIEHVRGLPPCFVIDSDPYPDEEKEHRKTTVRILQAACSNDPYDCGEARVVETERTRLEKEKRIAEEAKRVAEIEAAQQMEARRRADANEQAARAEKEALAAKVAEMEKKQASNPYTDMMVALMTMQANSEMYESLFGGGGGTVYQGRGRPRNSDRRYGDGSWW